MLSGDRLRALRIMHKITVEQMASAIGKSDRWVREIEACRVTPSDEIYQGWLDTVYGHRPITVKKREK